MEKLSVSNGLLACVPGSFEKHSQLASGDQYTPVAVSRVLAAQTWMT